MSNPFRRQIQSVQTEEGKLQLIKVDELLRGSARGVAARPRDFVELMSMVRGVRVQSKGNKTVLSAVTSHGDAATAIVTDVGKPLPTTYMARAVNQLLGR